MMTFRDILWTASRDPLHFYDPRVDHTSSIPVALAVGDYRKAVAMKVKRLVELESRDFRHICDALTQWVMSTLPKDAVIL